MPRYRKRPVVVDAHVWWKNGDHPDDDCEQITPKDGGQPFLGEGKVVRHYRDPNNDGNRKCVECCHAMHDHGWIDTLEGGHIVCPGDQIITGTANERYPCKPNIFPTIYELDDQDEQEESEELTICRKCCSVDKNEVWAIDKKGDTIHKTGKKEHIADWILDVVK